MNKGPSFNEALNAVIKAYRLDTTKVRHFHTISPTERVLVRNRLKKEKITFSFTNNNSVIRIGKVDRWNTKISSMKQRG